MIVDDCLHVGVLGVVLLVVDGNEPKQILQKKIWPNNELRKVAAKSLVLNVGSNQNKFPKSLVLGGWMSLKTVLRIAYSKQKAKMTKWITVSYAKITEKTKLYWHLFFNECEY